MASSLILFSLISLFAPPAVTPSPTPEAMSEQSNEHLDYWTRTLRQSPYTMMRKNAARVLGGMGNREAVPSLTEALTDSFYGTRLEAVKSLGLLGDERALPALNQCAEKDADKQVRREAHEAIERIKAHQEYQRKKLEKIQVENEKAKP